MERNEQESNTSPQRSGTEVLLTRLQAARVAGVSSSTIRRMEGTELEVQLIDGVHYFRSEDVVRIRRISDGELAAQMFLLFNDDKTPIDVVIELRQPAERVHALYRQWLEMGDYIVVEGRGPMRRVWELRYQVKLSRPLIQACLEAMLNDPARRAALERMLGKDMSGQTRSGG